MLYPTHIVASYVLSAVAPYPLLGLLVGGAIPDIIDKPLPRLGIVDTYHSVAHSVFPVVALVLIGSQTNGFVIAVAVGWAAHLGLDVIHVVTNGRASHWRFLLWPVDFASDPMRLPPIEFFKQYLGTRCSYLELSLWVSGIVVLYRDYLHTLA